MDLIGQYLAPVIPLIIALFALIIVLGVMSSKQEKEQKEKKGREIRDGEYGGKFIPATEFEENWMSGAVGASRVHAHFNGKGNGDVYADVRNGKHVYVQLKPCPKDQMNDLEKSLIAAFHATDSYNSTRGGSASR